MNIGFKDDEFDPTESVGDESVSLNNQMQGGVTLFSPNQASPINKEDDLLQDKNSSFISDNISHLVSSQFSSE